MFTYNINYKIKVKLTEYGNSILEKEITDILGMLKNFNYQEYCPYHEDEYGYTEFQLWDFMNIFGSHFSHGGSLIIEHNEIIFIDDVTETTTSYTTIYPNSVEAYHQSNALSRMNYDVTKSGK